MVETMKNINFNDLPISQFELKKLVLQNERYKNQKQFGVKIDEEPEKEVSFIEKVKQLKKQ